MPSYQDRWDQLFNGPAPGSAWDRLFNGPNAQGDSLVQFIHRGDFWMPNNPVGSGVWAQDKTLTLYGRDLPFLVVPGDETDVPEMAGRVQDDLVVTFDRLEFPSGSPVADGWFIHFTAAGFPDLLGQWWVIQGNATPQNASLAGGVPFLHAFGKTSPAPPGVS